MDLGLVNCLKKMVFRRDNKVSLLDCEHQRPYSWFPFIHIRWKEYVVAWFLLCAKWCGEFLDFSAYQCRWATILEVRIWHQDWCVLSSILHLLCRIRWSFCLKFECLFYPEGSVEEKDTKSFTINSTLSSWKLWLV